MDFCSDESLEDSGHDGIVSTLACERKERNNQAVGVLRSLTPQNGVQAPPPFRPKTSLEKEGLRGVRPLRPALAIAHAHLSEGFFIIIILSRQVTRAEEIISEAQLHK